MQELPFGRDTTLRRLLPADPAGTYDFVFFDCSPSLESLFNINVLVSRAVRPYPHQSGQELYRGLQTSCWRRCRLVREIANPDIRVLGIFMTAVETGAGLDREMIENLPRMLPELAFRTYIRKNIDVKKAPHGAMQPLCFFSPLRRDGGLRRPVRTKCSERMEG